MSENMQQQLIADDEQGRVYLTELQIEDFKKITLVRLTLGAGITELSGPNGAGKTSAIDAINVWLDGLRVSDDKELVRKGARRARIRGRLGDMYVIRTISGRKGGGHETEIRFEPAIDNPKQKSYPATQAMLADLIGEHNLDPLDFIKLDAKGKFDALRAFVPGYDFEKADRDNEADYSRRKDVNKLAKEARAASSMIIVPDGTPDDLVDEGALIRSLEEASQKNSDIRQAIEARDNALRVIREGREAASLTESLIAAGAADARGRLDKEVARQQAQIAQIQAHIQQLEQDCEREIARLSEELRVKAEDALTTADDLEAKLINADPVPEMIDIPAVSRQLQDARRVNESVRKAQTRANHIATAEKYEAESAELTADIDARTLAKQKAIAAATLPVPGIEFGEGEIRYNGVPFDQASMGQKLKVGVARSIALNPTLRLCWIRDASLLDDDSYAELGRLSQEFRCNILIETVRPIGKDAIVLVDGHVKNAPEARP